MEQRRGSTQPPEGDGADGDIAARATDLIESGVTAVRHRAVRPVVVAARALVFGVIVLTMLVVVAVAAAIGLVRLLDVYAFGGRVWASDALLGAVCCLAGALAWSRRRSAEAPR